MVCDCAPSWTRLLSFADAASAGGLLALGVASFARLVERPGAAGAAAAVFSAGVLASFLVVVGALLLLSAVLELPPLRSVLPLAYTHFGKSSLSLLLAALSLDSSPIALVVATPVVAWAVIGFALAAFLPLPPLPLCSCASAGAAKARPAAAAAAAAAASQPASGHRTPFTSSPSTRPENPFAQAGAAPYSPPQRAPAF